MADYSTLRIHDWDAAAKFASVIALVAGGIWTVWLYHQTAKQQASAAQMEAQKPFAGKRLDTYDKIVGLTATIAETELPAPLRRSKRQELDQIMNGPLALVAQDKIFAALLDFTPASMIGNVRKAASPCTRGTSHVPVEPLSRNRGA